MTPSRERILADIRAALGRGAPGAAEIAAIEARIAAHAPNLVPARGRLEGGRARDMFVAMAEESAATVAQVAGASDVPGALADYLAAENLPTRVAMAPAASLETIPWAKRPLLEIRRGVAAPDDHVSVTGAFAAVAETGTLMLVSGPEGPTTLNFLPDTHVVVVWRDQIVGDYEEGWSLLRRRDGTADGEFDMPRTVNYITGPSRSGDIEQTLLMGAHGPRRVHIILIDEQSPNAQIRAGA